MSTAALVPLDKRGLEIVKVVEGANFNEIIAMQHYMMTYDAKGNPKITILKPGLLNKMEIKYDGKAIPQAVIPTEDEEMHLRRMMGFDANDPLVIMKGVVHIPGSDQPFTDYGSASPRDTPNKRLLEMACTRAVNRAIRLATNCGFTSVEEMTEDISFEEAKVQLHQKKKPKQKSPLANDFRLFFIQVFCKGDASKFDGKLALTFFKQETGKHWQADDVTNADWNLVIAKLKSKLPKPEPEPSDLPADIAVDQDSDDLSFTRE